MKTQRPNITDDQLDALYSFAFEKYNGLDPTHGKAHAERTMRLAEFLAKSENADSLISRLGALLHQYHPEEAALVQDFMTRIGIDEQLASAVTHCVSCVEPQTIKNALTNEAKVVFDADKLQTLGPFGLIREIVYRMATKQLTMEEAVRQAEELQENMIHLLQTETGRTLAKSSRGTTKEFMKCFWRWEGLSFLK